jgi:hypothetical protein
LTNFDRWLCDFVVPAERPRFAEEGEDQDE